MRVLALTLCLALVCLSQASNATVKEKSQPTIANVGIDNSADATTIADNSTPAIVENVTYAPEVAYVDWSSSVATARSENQNFYGSTSTSTAPISAHVGHLNRATCWGRIDLGKRPGALGLF